MKKLDKELSSEDDIYYTIERTNYGKFFFVNCDRRLYDCVRISPNYEKGIRYNDIIKLLEENHQIIRIESKEKPVKGTDTVLLITPPNLRRDNAGEDFSEDGFFNLLFSKKFVIKNKNSFLNLLSKLVSNHLISHLDGNISYESRKRYVFINLNVAFKAGVTPFIMPKIYRNFDNIMCLFKYKTDDRLFLFCETDTHKYPIDLEHDEYWYYTFEFVDENGESYWTSSAYIDVNREGNVRIVDGGEKFTILSREIYAKSLEEGLEIFGNEMKNLGFNVKITEKKKVRDFK